MQKIFDLSESPTVYFQITGKGKVTSEIHSFLRMYENFNKLLMVSIRARPTGHPRQTLTACLNPLQNG